MSVSWNYWVWGPSWACVKLVWPLFHVIYMNTRTWDYRLGKLWGLLSLSETQKDIYVLTIAINLKSFYFFLRRSWMISTIFKILFKFSLLTVDTLSSHSQTEKIRHHDFTSDCKYRNLQTLDFTTFFSKS